MLVGEYTIDELAVRPEFAIADGIIRFNLQPEGLASIRELEIHKMRGSQIVLGRHFFEIDQTGFRFYPRVRVPNTIEQLTGERVRERVQTGVDGLDELLRGGLPRGSATLIEGGSGTGKTLLGLHFLAQGALDGESGLLFTFEETPNQLRDVAGGFGLDLERMESEGRLAIEYTAPVELSTDKFLNMARRKIEQTGATRVVLDSLSSMELGAPSERRFRELVYAMTKHFRAAGVTLLMTLEASALLGSAHVSGHGVMSSADNMILLRYVELDGRLSRALSVLKVRGVQHSTELRQASIGASGFQVGEPFTDLQGVLTGLPVRSSRPDARRS